MMTMLHCGGEGFFFRLANRLSPSRVCVCREKLIIDIVVSTATATSRVHRSDSGAPRLYIYVKGFTFTKASFCGKPFVVFHTGFWLLLLLHTAYTRGGECVKLQVYPCVV